MKNQRERSIAARAQPNPSISSAPEKSKRDFDPWELLETNLNAMREHYRLLPGEGPTKGIYVTMEIVTVDFAAAVKLARQGKVWTPAGR